MCSIKLCVRDPNDADVVIVVVIVASFLFIFFYSLSLSRLFSYCCVTWTFHWCERTFAIWLVIRAIWRFADGRMSNKKKEKKNPNNHNKSECLTGENVWIKVDHTQRANKKMTRRKKKSNMWSDISSSFFSGLNSVKHSHTLKCITQIYRH